MMYDLGPRARNVYAVLLDRISSGEPAPGARLPAHTQLAQTFGVAPLTMRQVLARLEADGFVARERGRGTFVRGGARPEVLIVARSPTERAALLSQLGHARQPAVGAATSAEGLAALEREPTLAMLIVDLLLPTARAGLNFARAARRRRPSLPIAVLDPTARQTSRLQHSVAPPLLILRRPLHTAQLVQLLSAGRPSGGVRRVASRAGTAMPTAQLLERYLVHQLAGERAAARQLLLEDGLAAGMPLADLYLGVLQPAQYRIGELWQHDQITIGREHLATAVTASVMAELAAAAPRAPITGLRVVVACVEGELHDLGARMVADLFEQDGFVVRFLGANVPTESLVVLVVEERPHLVVLSATMAEHLDQFGQALAGIREMDGARPLVAIGGQALEWAPDLARRLGADVTAQDARETLQAARSRLLQRSEPPAAQGTKCASLGES